MSMQRSEGLALVLSVPSYGNPERGRGGQSPAALPASISSPCPALGMWKTRRDGHMLPCRHSGSDVLRRCWVGFGFKREAPFGVLACHGQKADSDRKALCWPMVGLARLIPDPVDPGLGDCR